MEGVLGGGLDITLLGTRSRSLEGLDRWPGRLDARKFCAHF